MHTSRPAILRLAALTALGLTILPRTAQAQNFTDITGFAKNGNLHTNLNAQYPNDGIFSPGVFGGVSFDIAADGQGEDFAGITNGAPASVPVGVFGVTDVYTLINGFGPVANQTGATVTFTGSAGATQTFTLVNGTDVRDFYQGGYANTVNGTTTQQVFSVAGVGGAGTGSTPQTSTAGSGDHGTYVLDAQHFTLDSAFATQTLTGFTVTNGSGSQANFLSAVTVAAVPEASTTVSFGLLLALGLGGVMVARKKRVLA